MSSELKALRERVADENSWLIERWFGDTLHFWNCGNCGGRGPAHTFAQHFTPKIDDAVRFARKQDAEVILYHLLDGEGRAVEHVWTNMPTAALDGDTPNV